MRRSSTRQSATATVSVIGADRESGKEGRRGQPGLAHDIVILQASIASVPLLARIPVRSTFFVPPAVVRRNGGEANASAVDSVCLLLAARSTPAAHLHLRPPNLHTSVPGGPSVVFASACRSAVQWPAASPLAPLVPALAPTPALQPHSPITISASGIQTSRTTAQPRREKKKRTKEEAAQKTRCEARLAARHQRLTARPLRAHRSSLPRVICPPLAAATRLTSTSSSTSNLQPTPPPPHAHTSPALPSQHRRLDLTPHASPPAPRAPKRRSSTDRAPRPQQARRGGLAPSHADLQRRREACFVRPGRRARATRPTARFGCAASQFSFRGDAQRLSG